MPTKILLCGYPPEATRVGRHLKHCAHEIVWTDREPTEELPQADWLVSYGYRHILRRRHLDQFPDRAINLHISFLPWNRGADPNLWAWVDGTPHGVSIHQLDEGVDTGDIICQQIVKMTDRLTLRESYSLLQECMADLFIAWWARIRDQRVGRVEQSVTHGSTHKRADKERIKHLLVNGWDTPASVLLETPPWSV